MSEKAGLLYRFLAYLVDTVIESVLGLIPVLGGILGFLYFLLRDGIGDGHGVGKRLFNLRVVNYSDKGAISYADSARRNLVFALPALFLLIPFAGYIVYAILIVLVWLVETYNVIRNPEGRRFGDRWAGTMVVSAK